MTDAQFDALCAKIADLYKISADDLKGRCRKGAVSTARHCLMTVMAGLNMSGVDIGRYLGRHASSVSYGLAQFKKQTRTNPKVRAFVAERIAEIGSIAPPSAPKVLTADKIARAVVAAGRVFGVAPDLVLTLKGQSREARQAGRARRSAMFALARVFNQPVDRIACLIGGYRDPRSAGASLRYARQNREDRSAAVRRIAEALEWSFKFANASASAPTPVPETVRATKVESACATKPKPQREKPVRLNGWTDSEKARLTAGRARGETYAGLMVVLPGRSENAIKVQARKMGLAKPRAARQARKTAAARWTPAEDAIIRERRSRGFSWRQIARLLPGRTPGAVLDRAARHLNLTPKTSKPARLPIPESVPASIPKGSPQTGGHGQWSVDEIAVLREVADRGYSMATALSRLPGRDMNAVGSKARALGLDLSGPSAPRVVPGAELSSGPAIDGAVNRGVEAVLSLKPGQCKWPVGNPNGAEFKFCAAAKASGDRRYCAEHAALAGRRYNMAKRKKNAMDVTGVLDQLDNRRKRMSV